MRFNPASALLALPVLAAADSPDYQAQFQEYLGKAQGYFEKLTTSLPNPNKYDAAGAAAAKSGPNKLSVIGLDNWKETLYEPVTPASTTPEEWWLLITGGNKTCFGHCGRVEAAFNETAGIFTKLPDTPHMALLNCDNQPILCNAWSAPAGSLWIFEMLPEPSPINIYTKRLNLTTTTSEDLVKLHADGYKTVAKEHDGIFHPFNGPIAKNGLSVPAGYTLWAFSLLPSWAFMVVISLFSRRMMSSRMEGQMHGGPRPAPTGQATPRR
ncbi:hypothetical protein F5B22DRAFT_74718 [Xylaria bambusicola]|uniref:uncharacterized protein n=1 Tax=Xylaria bambusicola TaxID=326684 RepID=UPI002008AC03|nr:uncharacterized protein F5B22DRAFT_74718 [Xylaria bambusicola]KAI0518173.1 hypothetical protein F5B22DRAFT_74718 [Xylaria bambusicola]